MHPFYQTYEALNARVASGAGMFSRWGPSGLTFSEGPPSMGSRPLSYPRIGVYAGTGSSHSWLWFVDLFERTGFHDLLFLSEHDVRGGALRTLDVLAMSGGDTFMTAEALGREGAGELRAFVQGGGLYIGSCAGAYLPMNSSKKPLDLFNFAPVRITNLAAELPRAQRLSHKYCTSYGCAYIFHPVRENVVLRTTGRRPFAWDRVHEAPLYGGGGMTASREDEVLARYEGFTAKTLFLVDREVARQTLVGKAAIIRHRCGEGCFYLFGPHLEHPRFPEANRLVADAVFWDTAGKSTKRERQAASAAGREDGLRWLRDCRREFSNARIVATGLEFLPLRWRIGAKIYEPEKIRVFLESLWKRLRRLERSERVYFRSGEAEMVLSTARELSSRMRRLKRAVDDGADTLDQAALLFRLLHDVTTGFFRVYFRTLGGRQRLEAAA